MACQKSLKKTILASLTYSFIAIFAPYSACASDKHWGTPGNFGLPGIIELPTANRFPDGELVFTHQNNTNLFMSGISFQALPRLGVAFRYGGQGSGGGLAQGRVNWDRSFDAHFSVLDEGTYLPAISLGLRDFIGTGWYSSEYIVGSKLIGNLELTAGLGFGRLAGRDSFSNPLGNFFSRFKERGTYRADQGGTLGNINWFRGDASAFYGIRYQIGEKISISSEYTPDLMLMERDAYFLSYLDLKSPWNFGASYKLNEYVSFSAQYLYGSQASLTANVAVNPARPQLLGGKELAPVPMRMRGNNSAPVKKTDENAIRKVLAADRFDIFALKFEDNLVNIAVANTKFRSTAQAVGRLASTLQRFTSDDIKLANITFISRGLEIASYHVDLDKIGQEQFDPNLYKLESPSIIAVDPKSIAVMDKNKRLTWGLGPYITHRLFNPMKPLFLEAGVEIGGGFQLSPSLKLSGTVRKSILTNLTENTQRSDSVLPRVHSDWPLYDLAGQSGHIHEFALSYFKNIAPGFYGRARVGLLEPFFAGFGGEILYKPAQSSIGVGIDIHRVRKRDYDMRFDLLDYQSTLGHLSIYYDAGRMFEIEINVGRYLAGDWGATTTISRKFGSGWEVGGYATLTDVPFSTFGEGSFDKAIFVSIPIDWITSTPTQAQRNLTLRPITRDGGANLASARSLYRKIKRSQNSQFQREIGRLWK